MGPPTGMIAALKAELKLDEFVETGTFRGDTTAWAAQNFRRVTTIELSPKYHREAVERFRDQPHVRVLNGSSAAVLKAVVPALAGPALFWLDAHWSGLDTAGAKTECPLLEELGALNATAHPHVILVDDARLFVAPPPKPHRAEQWPDLATSVNALVDGGRRHVAIYEDMLVAVPSTARAFLVAWLQDAATAARNRSVRAPWWKKFRA